MTEDATSKGELCKRKYSVRTKYLLLKKLNTTGAFDTPWLREQLENWDVVAEQKKADFMEHMYQVYKPVNKCYTGLWQRFCIQEAGPAAREQYFEMLEAIRMYEEQQAKGLDTIEL